MAIESNSHYYIKHPHVLMREKPIYNATVVSDANYSEGIEILEIQGKWVKIRTKVDGYVGWIKNDKKDKSIFKSDGDFYANQTIAKTNQIRVHLYGLKDTEQGAILTLGFGSRLVVKEWEPADARWVTVTLFGGRIAYVQSGHISKNLNPLPVDSIAEFSKMFMRLPYNWGGRSSLDGYDCSGFTQMLYLQMGLFIPRDSKDQFAWLAFKKVEIDQLKLGDLIFWGKDEENIRHVGMSLGDRTFIHSTVAQHTPTIHISNLDDPTWNGTDPLRPYRAARRLAQLPVLDDLKKM